MGREEEEATLEASSEVGSYLQENTAFHLFWGPNNIPPPPSPDKQTLQTKYKHNYHCSVQVKMNYPVTWHTELPQMTMAFKPTRC